MKTIAAIAVMAALLPAQKQEAPPVGAPRPFEFPKAQKKVLDNGLTVYVVEDHRLPLVSYSLAINAGSSLDTPAKSGLANLTAALLREGTKTRKANDISKLVDNAGGTLGASVTDDYASVISGFMKSHADLGLELLADITMNPSFPQEEIDRQMRQLLSGLQVAYASPESLAVMASGRAMLGNHPYAYPSEGTPETARALKREDLVAFHARHYVPSNAILVIAGDTTAEEGFAKAAKYLGGWMGARVNLAALRKPEPGKPGVLIIDMPTAVQTQIRVGHASIARNDAAYLALQTSNQIFGGSFNSRVNMKLRANEGLTYGATSALNAQRQAGTFMVSTFTRNEKTADAVQMILDLFKEWKANPATQAEFDEAQRFLVGSFGVSVETAEAVAGRVMGAALNGLGDDYWSSYRGKLLALKREDIAAVVGQQIDVSKLQIVCVGKAADIAKPMEKFGPVTVIPAAEFDPVAPDMRKAKEAAVTSSEGMAAAKKLVDRAVAAVGGMDALAQVNDMASEGAMTMITPQGKMEAESKEWVVFPSQFRVSLKLPFGEIIQASDGGSAWVKQMTQPAQDLPPQMVEEIKRGILRTAALGLLREAGAGRATLAGLAPLTRNGAQWDGVLWKQDTHEVKIYFDPATGLPAMVVSRTASPAGMVEQETEYSDWRLSGPVKLPYAEVISQGGNRAGERKWAKRSVNAGVAPETFKKPAQ